jgi:hypothetical protein
MLGYSAISESPFSSLGAGGISYSSAVGEAALVSEIATARAVFSSLYSDIVVGTDIVRVSSASFRSALQEASTVSDAVASTSIFVSSVSELASVISSTAVSSAIYNLSIGGEARVADQTSVQATFSAITQDGVTVQDVLLARFLWELIEDFQSVNWQLINDSSPTVWNLTPNKD